MGDSGLFLSYIKVGKIFDAALFPVWFPSEYQERDLQKLKSVVEYVRVHGTLPPEASIDAD